MSEVSCRAFSYFLDAEKRGFVRLDELLEGCPIPRATLENPSARVPWDQWALLCERFAVLLGSDEALLDSSTLVLSERFAGGLARMLGIIGSPRQLYEVACGWVAPSLYRSLTFRVLPVPGSSDFDLELRLKPGFRPCRPWFVMAEGGFANLTAFLGLPPAKLERRALDGSFALLRVTPPPSRTSSFWSRAWAALKTPDTLFRELVVQQEQLDTAFEDMRRSTRAFRNTLDALPHLLAVHDKSEAARLLYANPAFASFFGRTQASLVGVELASLFPGAARAHPGPDARPRLVELQREGGTRELEVSGVDGIEFGGQQVALFHARDLTTERRAERQAARSEAALSSLLESFPDLVLRFDEGLVLRSVHGGRDVTDASLVMQQVGHHARDVALLAEEFQGTSTSTLLSDLEQVRRGGTPVARRVRWGAPDARRPEFLVRMVPLGNEVVVIVHDETQRRDVERRLAVAERMASLGTLAAGVAHEINNPLTWVLTNVELLEDQVRTGPLAADAPELVSEIRDGALRIRDTVARMRDFSRVRPTQSTRVDLNAVLERAARMTQHEMKHCARLELDLGYAPTVAGDETELGQVFVNLLVNAAQAMPPGASPVTHSVKVTLRSVEGDAVVTVTDTGTGIPGDVKDHVFDPFVTTKVGGKGTGLGLAIALRSVQSCGGSIDFESRPGCTVFSVRLPPATAHTPLPQPTPERKALPRRAKVLVIDDEPLVRRSLGRALVGHDVTQVESGEAGLAALREGQPLPDLILCDLMMPGRTGMDVWAELERARPEALSRVVFMTGGTFTPRAEAFLAQRATRVLQKPVEAQALLDVLAGVVSASSA